jgi:hypothetical protein
MLQEINLLTEMEDADEVFMIQINAPQNGFITI